MTAAQNLAWVISLCIMGAFPGFIIGLVLGANYRRLTNKLAMHTIKWIDKLVDEEEPE